MSGLEFALVLLGVISATQQLFWLIDVIEGRD